MISSTANQLNTFLRDRQIVLDSDEKQFVVGRLVEVMEARLTEADATDCSRFAWLYIHLRNTDKAKAVTLHGLKLDPSNRYCTQLAERLKMP
jgi:hypothetical protein